MKHSKIVHIIPDALFTAVLLLSLSLLFSSCSTGIESTKAIRMSRTEKKDARPSAEDLLIASLRPEPLQQWQPGKRFLVADNKVNLLLEQRPSAGCAYSDSLKGRTLAFVGYGTRPTPGGGSVAVIEFKDFCANFTYNTERPIDRLAETTGLDLPMLIDLDLVSAADSLLSGRMLWTLSSLWYDNNGDIIKGRRYVPVEVTAVTPGDMIFPLRVHFRTLPSSASETSQATPAASASMLMNIVATNGLGAESRTFPGIFSLTDPKLKYPAISSENWELIRDGRVALGMTKEECRLALGNPTDVDAGHNWSSVIDVWKYNDGTFLHFQDGLLVNFRH